MGTQDLPAIINFILKETGREKLSYIGHSQGTAQLFAAMSLNMEYYQNRINCFLALGPVTSLENLGSTFLKVAANSKLDKLLSFFGATELLGNSQALAKFQTRVCKMLKILCEGVINMLADSNPKVDDPQRFLVFVGHYPAGTSIKTLQHLGHLYREKGFMTLDGSKPYALNNIKGIPISLFVGKDDRLATVEDCKKLRWTLEYNGALDFYKEYEDMGHLTFFVGKKNEHLKDMLTVLDKYNFKS